jgi:hypothetical protein
MGWTALPAWFPSCSCDAAQVFEPVAQLLAVLVSDVLHDLAPVPRAQVPVHALHEAVAVAQLTRHRCTR